jgi:thymidylate kinase
MQQVAEEEQGISSQELLGAAAQPGECGRILTRVFDVLDRAGVEYCVLHGYEEYPRHIPSDVDCLVPPDVLPRGLVELLHENRDRIGAEVVQRLDGETCYLVLAGAGPEGSPCFLPLDVSGHYDLKNRTFYDGAEILATRRCHQSFWVPAVDLEFGSYLVRKIAKGRLDEAQGRRLSALYRQAPDRCRLQVGRFWGGAGAGRIVSAAESGDWSDVGRHLPRLREELLRRRARSQPVRLCRNWLSSTLARVGRWLRPEHGLSIVLLGPDGAGKSSLAKAIGRTWAPAFFRISHRSFPPALRNLEPAGTCTAPHEVRPRSCLASTIRAILYWFVYYGPGYFVTIRPALARFTLVVFDRHLVDALVDPRRYRYTGPSWLLRLIWKLVPKPDMVILLDAPAEVIHARKREVPLEETRRQRAAYRSLVEAMPGGMIVDAARPIEEVTAEVDRLILRFLATRVARRCIRTGRGE